MLTFSSFSSKKKKVINIPILWLVKIVSSSVSVDDACMCVSSIKLNSDPYWINKQQQAAQTVFYLEGQQKAV